MVLEIFKKALHLRDWHIFMRQSLEWGFVDELSGYGFKSCCSNLNSRYRACFEQGVPWRWSNCRVYIHSKTRMWNNKNTVKCTIQISTHNAAQSLCGYELESCCSQLSCFKIYDNIVEAVKYIWAVKKI